MGLDCSGIKRSGVLVQLSALPLRARRLGGDLSVTDKSTAESPSTQRRRRELIFQ
jgi:hypothetical protein